MIKKMIFAAFVLLISVLSLSFNWGKCRRSIPGGSQFFGVSTSSMQFTTSWGDCAMIGFSNHDKMLFIAKNLEKLKTDSSRGGGEYIDSYAYISKCNEMAQNVLPRLLQENFEVIYGPKAQKGPKSVYESMDQVMKNDPIVSKDCKLDS